MIAAHLRRSFAASLIAAAALAFGATGATAADPNCLAKITPIAVKAGAILGYSVRAMHGEVTYNCNLIHFPIKVVDIATKDGRTSYSPQHPSVYVSYGNPTPAQFAALVKRERKYGGFVSLGGLGPLATLFVFSGHVSGFGFMAYLHGTSVDFQFQDPAQKISQAQAVKLGRLLAAQI
jgi:hypothetical protein